MISRCKTVALTFNPNPSSTLNMEREETSTLPSRSREQPQMHSQFAVKSSCLCYGDLHNIWQGACSSVQGFPTPALEPSGTVCVHKLEYNVSALNGTWKTYQLVDIGNQAVRAWEWRLGANRASCWYRDFDVPTITRSTLPTRAGCFPSPATCLIHPRNPIISCGHPSLDYSRHYASRYVLWFFLGGRRLRATWLGANEGKVGGGDTSLAPTVSEIPPRGVPMSSLEMLPFWPLGSMGVVMVAIGRVASAGTRILRCSAILCGITRLVLVRTHS
ncbi:uncharacterized protein PAC_17946 [Phialocephala subalpina]|uniref:Uncharacterized protein n=1 Tax=Phialocephala subalpina TaxID=576137 RepID=A0A1L7XSV5_9HELO|nr:uncharacterized protein PAC_17946 [Phialocephala subalpina]